MTEWVLVETAAAPDGTVRLRFLLPENALPPVGWPAIKVQFTATISDRLAMELAVTNTSAQNFVYENLLHSYFAVTDIAQVSVTGLQGHHYLDKTDGFARKLQSADALTVTSQVDRVYLDATGPVTIHDAQLRRQILVEKTGSASTVLWNPWVDWSKATADFGDEDYQRMICVESGNVGGNQVSLAPGASATLKVVIRTQPG
jgi:D-hexose-6-phosphate mutarotase